MHQPQIDGSSHGISGISAITRRLQNLDTRRGTARSRFTRCFHASFGWSLTSVEVILLPGLSSPASLRLLRRLLLRRLVQLDYDSAVALRSVWFFLIFPTAYFLHVGYSESLFLALALASVLAARVDRWGLAGLLGAFCWLTRAAGAVLVPTLAVEAAQKYSTNRRWNPRWLWIALVPAGFAIYLLLNWRVTGDALAFLQTRKDIVRAIVCIAFGWHLENDQSALPDAERSGNGRRTGIGFPRYWIYLHDH